MQASQGAARAVAPLVLTVVFGLAACGGGGGGGGSDGTSAAAGSSTTSASAGGAGASGGGTSAAGTDSAGASGGTGTSMGAGASAQVVYSLGPVRQANTTTEDYQTLEGLAPTASGYRVVWSTAVLDANMTLQRTWFERRFDTAGQPLGGETVIPPPSENLSATVGATVRTIDGGTVQFTRSNQLRPALLVQQFDAAGTPVGAPIPLQGPSHGHTPAAIGLPDGSVALAWQPLSSVGPGEVSTAVLTHAAAPGS